MMKKKIVVCVMLFALFAALGAAIFEIKNSHVYITQYADQSGSQGMVYTITKGKKTIVVDGGNEENTDYLEHIIADRGNHVDAWILTHPHPDHIGAFNKIIRDGYDVKIDVVYTIDLIYEKYKALARPWDEIECYEEFLKLEKNLPVKYVHTGDKWEISGLKFEALSAYSPESVGKISKDLANDGSMMFKVTNKKESMLFCADVTKKMSKSIISQYADKLPSDYIQMGHHGNNGLSKRFYRMVSPKAAFFDAPEWLMNPEDPDTRYTTPQTRKLMEKLGAAVWYYATAPNQIRMY